MPLFKLVKKNKLSEYFCELLSEIVTFWLKREVFSELARKCFKTTGKHNLAVCGSFWGEKQFLLIFVLHLLALNKKVVYTNPNFPLAFLLFKLVEKSNLSEYFWASFWDSHFLYFLNKKRSFQWIFPLYENFFKTTGKHSLAVCGLFWGEKQFLLIFVPFYWFDQKQLFKQIQIFLLICPFQIC